MSIKSKLLILLNLLAVGLLIAACGLHQNSQSAEPAVVNGEANPRIEKEQDEDKPDEHEHDESIELATVDLAGGEKLKVVATTNIVGDLVRNVGGDMIELTTMLPIGADPHTFAPAPQDAVAVADAHVVFVNGLHLEEFLEELIENAGGKAPIVTLSANVETREFEQNEDDHTHEGIDPHVWMTPANAIIMVYNIERALSNLDPANAEAYKANAKAYETELEELDDWVTAQIKAIPAENRKLITDHDTLGYYADRYGLEVVGAVIPAYSTNAEPSAQELAELQQEINEFSVPAIFVGATINPVLAERVSEDTGIKLVPLYTGSLGQASSGAESYLNLIRYNTTAIVEALK